MKEKLLAILGSVRFWMITMGSLSILAGHYFPSTQFFFDTIAAWLGLVTGVGTIDKVVKTINTK